MAISLFEQIVHATCDNADWEPFYHSGSYPHHAHVTRAGCVIGPYCELTALAKELRAAANAALRALVFENLGARVGRRKTDCSPSGDRRARGFRARIEGKAPQPDSGVPAGRAPAAGELAGRKTEHFAEIDEFYRTKTLEAHHIVEKSILEALRVDFGELERTVAPCVLVTAELHQQLFTPQVAKARDLLVAKMKAPEVAEALAKIYTVTPGSLYDDPAPDNAWMTQLKDIAAIIVAEVTGRKSSR